MLITGGSSGLGLELARTWGQAGAQVNIVARDPGKLEAAVSFLAKVNIPAQSFSADVTNPEQVAELAKSFSAQSDRLDVLVNAAGKSARGLAATTSPAEFEELWRINFLATVHCSQTFLPLLKKSQGHLVNIGSLASKVAAPNLGAYPASKFPVAAFSQQLRLEMKEPAAHVLLVCPGPITREDAGSRYDDQSADLPESARKPGGGVKVKTLNPSVLSREILAACERRQRELIMPTKARWLFALQQFSPRLGDWLLRKKME